MSEPDDAHVAFRRLQMSLDIDDQMRSHKPPPVIREEDYEVVAVVVYDRKKGEIRYEKPADRPKAGVP